MFAKLTPGTEVRHSAMPGWEGVIMPTTRTHAWFRADSNEYHVAWYAGETPAGKRPRAYWYTADLLVPVAA